MVALKRVTVKLDQVTGGDSVGRESSGLIEWNAVHAAPSDSARVRTFGKRSVTLLGGSPQRKDGTRLASGRLREELCHGHPYLVTLSGMARGFVQTGFPLCYAEHTGTCPPRRRGISDRVPSK